MSLETSRLRITGSNIVNGVYELETERQTITQPIRFVPGLKKPFNMVDAADAITPVSELWTLRSGASSLLIMVPFNATQAYYYDIVNTGDDCMVIRNCYRRLYTRPTPTTLATGTNESLVKTASNLEIAVRVRKAGTSHTYRFIPQHQSVNTCVLVSRTITRNGVALSGNDAAYVPTEVLQINSLYNCFHPDEVNPLATLQLNHTVTAKKIRAEVTLTFLQDTDVDPGYTIMNNTTLTPRGAAVYRRDTAAIVPVVLPGTQLTAPGAPLVTGCAMGATNDTTVLVCDWSDNLTRVVGNQEFSNPATVQFFVNSTNKFYNTLWGVDSNSTVPAGRSFSWAGEWRMAQWSSILGGV
jgi:hypothetical protein